MSHSEQGYYSDRGQPLVELRVLGRESEFFIFQALVDTGFNDTVLAFESDAKLAGWPVTKRYHSLSLADGSKTAAYWTTGLISWLGKVVQREVLVFAGNRPEREYTKVGMGLLRGTRLFLGASRMEIEAE